MLNNKKIWATIIISFSIRRNLLNLAWDINSRKKLNLLRPFTFIALLWVSLPMTFMIANSTYPANFMIYNSIIKSPIAPFIAAGDIFGYDLLLFCISFQLMYEKLGDIYIRNNPFNPFIFVMSLFLSYMIPMGIFVACIVTIYPFIGEGPIFQ